MKLIRDNVPEIVAKSGKRAVTHIADEAEYKKLLVQKLQEEVDEYKNVPHAEELADIVEVVHALAAQHGKTPADIEQIRKDKAEKRGAFSKKIILDRTE